MTAKKHVDEVETLIAALDRAITHGTSLPINVTDALAGAKAATGYKPPEAEEQ